VHGPALPLRRPPGGGLRWLLIGIPTNLLDTGVLVGATVTGITVASLLLPRLAR